MSIKSKKETIDKFSKICDISKSIESILNMHTSSIKFAIKENKIPESAGMLEVIVNQTDNNYQIKTIDNGVGITESEFFETIQSMSDTNYDQNAEQWFVSVFGLCEMSYTLYSNDRRSDEMFVSVCDVSSFNLIKNDELKQSNFRIENFGTKLEFMLNKNKQISNIGSEFRDQLDNLNINSTYELRKDGNILEKSYYNF